MSSRSQAGIADGARLSRPRVREARLGREAVRAAGQPVAAPSAWAAARGHAADGVRWALALALGLLAFIGFLHLTRGTAVRDVRGIAADGIPIAVTEPHFPAVVTMLTGTWMLPGTRVEVALNGDGTYPRLWQDLQSAQRSITLQIYYGNTGRTAETLVDILRERAAAGVQVYLLYDAFGTSSMPAHHLEALRAGGVRVQPFRPVRFASLHMAQHRGHVRGVVIDGRVGWTGGFGIDDKWLGDGRREGSWRETNVRFEGPAVRQLQSAFAAAWVEATGELLTSRTAIDEHDDGVGSAGLLYAAPTMGSTSAERFFALSVAGARKSLYITNSYFAPNDNFVRLLVDAARRGVDVRVLTAGPQTDVGIVRLAGRGVYEDLLRAGVRVYEWQPSNLHAKTFVVDGTWATIGTMNFDNRSMALNDEATLMVQDAAFGRQMQAIFLEDLAHAEEIRMERFRERGWTSRLAEGVARLLTRLL